ncbi:glucan phosphoethanolaminetransferase (alkaline phosphatase superfamily) [Lysobacter enzymogenes]|jgi:hypothetical protein|uniref:hypothetical protein n=1 Tax=Lysobacter enzymogenes TaxID=69 RepID=UPI003394409C
MDALKSLLSDLWSTVREWIKKILSDQRKKLSGRDLKIVSICIGLVSTAGFVSFFWEAPLYSRQFTLLIIIIVGYLLGLCSTARSRVWAAFLSALSLVVWAYETYVLTVGVVN